MQKTTIIYAFYTQCFSLLTLGFLLAQRIIIYHTVLMLLTSFIIFYKFYKFLLKIYKRTKGNLFMGKQKSKKQIHRNTLKEHNLQIRDVKGDININQSRNDHNQGIQQTADTIMNIEEAQFFSEQNSENAKTPREPLVNKPPAGDSRPIRTTWPTVILLIAAILLASVTLLIFIYEKTQPTENKTENTQKFSATSQNTEKAGLSYIEYTITSEPSRRGFHVRPYPYVTYEENGETTIIPILNLFTQEEYSAEISGKCSLMHELLPSSFRAADNSDYSFTAEQVQCLIAVLYTKDTEQVRDMYELRDGDLTYADENIAIQLLQFFENPDSSPSIDSQNLDLSIP